MKDIYELISGISPPDTVVADAARRQWDSIAKPLGSLGRLEDAMIAIAALTGDAKISLEKRALLVFCADNGVVSRGVTQCGSEVTTIVADALGAGQSTVNPMAQIARCAVIPVDVGILNYAGSSGVLGRRIQNGTKDITTGAAMSREACVRAVLTGAVLAMEKAGEGVNLLAVGEMGIGNTTTAAAILSALLSCAPESVIGRGAGLSDAGLKRKLAAVQSALDVNDPNPTDPLDVISKIGGLDIAAMCGAFLGAANSKTPVLIDGLISAVAALCAVRLCPEARHAMLASHVSAEPAGALVLSELGLCPLLSAEMRLGEGSGAVAAIPLLDMALAVYQSGQTFSKLGIEPYIKQS